MALSAVEWRNEAEAAESAAESRVVYRKVAHCIDPLQDRRWDEFLQRHPRASVFHSSAWLEALSRTYGYTPVAYTTSPAGQTLENGMVFCRIESWLTGRRLVSLPFSDHCEPLADAPEDLEAFTVALEEECWRGQWRYIEVRPLQPFEMLTALQGASMPYTFHHLDLAPDIDTLFRNCHKNSTQRKILRAEREGLQYREGSTEKLLNHFYRLLAMTRKRHQRPPQPRKWFANLIDSFGDALKIRVAFKGERAVAAVLTIRYKDSMVYKYGGSDPRFNNLGGMHLLLWRAIQEAKASGLHSLDFGRTDADQQGLITFKQRWGTTESSLIYSRYGPSSTVMHVFDSSTADWKSKVAKYVLAHMQPGVLSLAGRVLYRHVG
jgi:CelD/BcsL family acetyltransferase involved in cellulose biosynthesis